MPARDHLVVVTAHHFALKSPYTLISDPRSAVEKELGLKVAAGIRLEVIEESSKSLCLLLPAAKGELSDRELESVAGGKFGTASGDHWP